MWSSIHHALLLVLVVSSSGAAQASAAIYQHYDIGSAKAYHFRTTENWAKDKHVRSSAKIQSVMEKMHPNGLFTAIVMPKTAMSIVGEHDGATVIPSYFFKNVEPDKDYAFVEGGFFIKPGRDDPHKNADKNVRLDVDQPLLPEAEIIRMGFWTVGRSSIKPGYVDPPKLDRPWYHKLTGDDGSYFYAAPSLKGDDSPKHRSIESSTPGGLASSNQPNERAAAMELPDKTRVVFAYNSGRPDGLRINEWQELVDMFTREYLGKSVGELTFTLNLDGGGSIYIGWVRNNECKVLALGGADGELPALPYSPPSSKKFRPIATMVKFELRSQTLRVQALFSPRVGIGAMTLQYTFSETLDKLIRDTMRWSKQVIEIFVDKNLDIGNILETACNYLSLDKIMEILYSWNDLYLETDTACAVKSDLLLDFKPVKDEPKGAILNVEYSFCLVSKMYKPDSKMLMQNANQDKF
ncbi:hypothetical protein LX36DRAFT_705571 [Colletotrichum falcatum]|nr:hypothetical protein LX36DRAFT_705571 [Colletotrichum falcatum]